MRLFDTTFLVDLVNADEGAQRFAQKVDEENSISAVSVVSVHEYLFGVHFRYHSDKARLKEKLESAQKELARFEVLVLTEEIVDISSKVQADLARTGKIIGINDVYVAATAIKYEFRLVTRNLNHFRRISGLSLESY